MAAGCVLLTSITKYLIDLLSIDSLIFFGTRRTSESFGSRVAVDLGRAPLFLGLASPEQLQLQLRGFSPL